MARDARSAWCRADERRQTLAQIRGGVFIDPVIDLAGIDEVLTLTAGEIDAVPSFTVKREASDRQCLTLLTGLFYPGIAATGDVGAVAHL